MSGKIIDGTVLTVRDGYHGGTVITVHDGGCRYAREGNGGHTEAAKRFSDRYNLHKMAGERQGWIAVRFMDGGADDLAVFPSRYEAVRHVHHNEGSHAFVELTAAQMSVCEAASVLRFQAQSRRLGAARPDRDAPGGGLVVVPRLTIEDQARQIAAMNGRGGLPVALGRVR